MTLLLKQKEKTKPKFSLRTFCFPEQFAFIEDKAEYKTAVCSRRSGKTIACAAHLIDSALKHANSTNLYITLSRLNAKRIIWAELKKINQEYQLGAEPNESELVMNFNNGSKIYLTGAKDQKEIEKFRGIAIKLCYIDEAQSFRAYIKELIDDVIGPALMDYAGTLCLIGTPGPVPAGYFYDCAVTSQNWSHHAWTFWQNPFISQKAKRPHQDILDRELKRRGITVDDPSIQREWFGKWVLDLDSLLIKYNEQLCSYAELPAYKYEYILGIDLGFKDADALALIGWSHESATTYLIEEVVTPKQGITELVDQIKALRERYQISKFIIDEGGLGKKLAEEIRRRHGVPVQPAEKQRKMENVAFLNDAIRTGKFKAKKGSRFAQDSFLVEIDIDRSTPDRVKIKDGYHSDIIDAVLYAFKASPAYTYREPAVKHKYGTAAWQVQEAAALEEAAEQYFQEQENKWL